MNRASAVLVKGLMRIGPQHSALCRRRLRRTADAASAAALAVPGDGRHGGGAAHRHAEPRDDRRTWRALLACRADAVAAAALCAIARAHRLSLRHASLGARLAARALHLVRHAAAVRRPRDHAVLAADPLRRHDGTDHHRTGGGGASRFFSSARVCTPCRRSASRSPPISRRRIRGPRVVALLCAMLLVGMGVSALAFGALLANFSAIRLIQVVQGAAVVTMVLNCVALWKQEARGALPPAQNVDFSEAWKRFASTGRARRRLFATALGTAGFSMQDISARTLWRARAALACQRNNGAHRDAGARQRRGTRHRGAMADARRRSPSRRRRWRGCRRRRLLRGDLRGAGGLLDAVQHRRHADRPWRRPFCAWHAHRLHADGAAGRSRPCARRLGRRAGDRGRSRHCGERRHQRRGLHARRQRRAGRGA